MKESDEAAQNIQRCVNVGAQGLANGRISELVDANLCGKFSELIELSFASITEKAAKYDQLHHTPDTVVVSTFGTVAQAEECQRRIHYYERLENALDELRTAVLRLGIPLVDCYQDISNLSKNRLTDALETAEKLLTKPEKENSDNS